MEEFNINNNLQIVLDGCHNTDSMHIFLSELRDKCPLNKLVVLLGIGMEKCLDDIINEVIRLADNIIVIQSKHFKSCTEIELNIMLNKNNTNNKNINVLNIEPHKNRIIEGTVSQRLEYIISNSNR
jgi:folylpolyglutamate synthase/dihydropteroate synthase